MFLGDPLKSKGFTSHKHKTDTISKPEIVANITMSFFFILANKYMNTMTMCHEIENKYTQETMAI